mmetsp:Transcript_70387/g.155247  ORF Transcript_70387/g.155247 Transcript_70387/m.155247 type:complete len:145 (+) Transcript_70387:32-466(+)
MSLRMSMMKPAATRGALISSRSTVAPVSRRAAVVVRAEDKPDGFIQRDNSGKANLYPTVAKPFEAGGAADTATDAGANLAYAGGAGAVAVLAVVIAVAVGGAGPKEADYSEFAEYKSLSAYRAEFASELGYGKAAAAPAVVADE